MHFWIVVWHVMWKATACKGPHTTVLSIVATWHHSRWRRNKQRRKNFIKGRLMTWNTFWKWISSIQMALMWIKVGIPVKCSVAPGGPCIMYNEWAWFSLMHILWCDSVWSGNMGHCSQAVSGAIHIEEAFALKNARRGQWNKEISTSFNFVNTC